MSDLTDIKIVEDKYGPPETIWLITRARHLDESFEDWIKNCVTIVTNVRMPKDFGKSCTIPT